MTEVLKMVVIPLKYILQSVSQPLERTEQVTNLPIHPQMVPFNYYRIWKKSSKGVKEL